MQEKEKVISIRTHKTPINEITKIRDECEEEKIEEDEYHNQENGQKTLEISENQKEEDEYEGVENNEEDYEQKVPAPTHKFALLISSVSSFLFPPPSSMVTHPIKLSSSPQSKLYTSYWRNRIVIFKRLSILRLQIPSIEDLVKKNFELRPTALSSSSWSRVLLNLRNTVVLGVSCYPVLNRSDIGVAVYTSKEYYGLNTRTTDVKQEQPELIGTASVISNRKMTFP